MTSTATRHRSCRAQPLAPGIAVDPEQASRLQLIARRQLEIPPASVSFPHETYKILEGNCKAEEGILRLGRTRRRRKVRHRSMAAVKHLEGRLGRMDTILSSRRSEIMAHVRSKDKNPELLVRKLVFAMGYRYRLHRQDLPERPNLVFRLPASMKPRKSVT